MKIRNRIRWVTLALIPALWFLCSFSAYSFWNAASWRADAGYAGVQAAPQGNCCAFGEVIPASGPVAKVNPSTKYQDDQTDLLYYGYRYYNAGTGRWLSRDPIGEKGGPNEYAIVQNDPVGGVDPIHSVINNCAYAYGVLQCGYEATEG